MLSITVEPKKPLAAAKAAWKIVDGEFHPHTDEEKTYRALWKALATLLPKKGDKPKPEENFQYYVKGPEFFIESVTSQGQGTYRATGRVIVGKINMATDEHSEETCSFVLSFKDDKDEWGHQSIKVLDGNINALPPGSRLTP